MIDKLSIITKVLFPYRKVALVLIFLLALNVVYSFFFQSHLEQDSIALPCFLAMLWLGMCYLLLGFLHKSAEHAELASSNKLNIIKRLKKRVQRGFYYFFAVLFLGLTLALSILTFRIITIWL